MRLLVECAGIYNYCGCRLRILQGPERYPQTLRVNEPMDTVFVKEVRPNGPAHLAGLKTGDRLWTVNGLAVDGMQYAHVVSIIQQVPNILTLQIIPKEFDFLQTVSDGITILLIVKN